MEQPIQGLIAGIIATFGMTLAEIPSWKRWELQGVFEWHENQLLTVYLTRKNGVSYYGIFGLHFLNGTLAGLAFPFIESYLVPSAPILLSGATYGIMLWGLTLFPVHKLLTELHPWNHPLGKLPAILSLAGHILYGLVLGGILVEL
jgi:hypothetical protein